NSMIEARIEIAESILRSGGELILRGFRHAEGCPGSEPSTATPIDLAVNQVLIEQISKTFPHDRIFSEESGFTGPESDYLWVIDPIDGTSNLTLGVPYVASSLAVQHSGETLFSAVFNPLLDEMIVAEKGSGAFLNGRRIRVSEQSLPSVGYYVQGHRVPPVIQPEILRKLLPGVNRMINTWAPTLDYCSIARGRAEFLVGYDTEAEDAIQGILILEEAGGKVSTWENRRVHFDLRRRQRLSLLATNGAVHEEICELLSRVPISASLQGSVSAAEAKSIQETAAYLSQKLRSINESVIERFEAELGLSSESFQANSGIRYLIDQADALRIDPQRFLRAIFDGVAAHLSGEEARRNSLRALRLVAEYWEPKDYPMEIVAQALEIAASDVRLHDGIQLAGYGGQMVDLLSETIAVDSLGVGVRLKRNAFRKLWAVAGVNRSDPLPPVRQLSDLTFPIVAAAPIGESPEDGFAALIVTGGRGTRLRTSVPKGLIPLGRRPLIEYTIEGMRAAGAAKIIVVVGYKGDLHQAVFDKDVAVLEQEEQLGTAHAVFAARQYLDGYTGPLLVSYSDMPFIKTRTLRALIDTHCSENAVMTLLTADRKDHPEFGRVFRREGGVCSVGQVRFEARESDEVDAGFYCVKAPEFWHYLGRVRNANNRREFILTEVVMHLSEGAQKIETYSVKDSKEVLGINRPSEYVEAARMAYVHSRLGQERGDHGFGDERLYWLLRFYEAFGGVRADQLMESASDLRRADEIKGIIAAYDSALTRTIGPIFRCPDIRLQPRCQ
ncbi:MAG TPA: inositol monophosphatase family protein, partial [Blastocatellia bacterium]|nr:inositol monophosphatase family protein [Blastocatellia bacterium]